MPESNQEGYLTLGWIINQSEQGLFLAVADEEIQQEIVKVYERGAVEVYDYKRHPGAYSFQEFSEWAVLHPDTRTLFLVNFQLAVQSDEDLLRLNFSRDMLENLDKNIIFCTTPRGDEQLAVGAYDFYSYLKLRTEFHIYREDAEKQEKIQMNGPTVSEKEWTKEEARRKLKETYELLKQAEYSLRKARYVESEASLLKAKEIRERLLGSEHLETVDVDVKLADIYERLGEYQKAERLCKKALFIRERVLGEEHPDTAVCYCGLSFLYGRQGRYKEAEELCKKALAVREKILGEEHLDTADSYDNQAFLYRMKGKYQEAEVLYKKVLTIRENVLGENSVRTATGYMNLGILYRIRGKYQEAEALYRKALHVHEKRLGENHPDTANDYYNLALLNHKQGEYHQAEAFYEKALAIDERILGNSHPQTIKIQTSLQNLRKRHNCQ